MSQRDSNPSSTPSSPNIDDSLSGSDTVVETTSQILVSTHP